jgi:hypothetical protein
LIGMRHGNTFVTIDHADFGVDKAHV